MKKSELIALLNALEGGNVEVFIGEMRPLTADDIEIREAITEDPNEREQYGEKYLHIGEC